MKLLVDAERDSIGTPETNKYQRGVGDYSFTSFQKHKAASQRLPAPLKNSLKVSLGKILHRDQVQSAIRFLSKTCTIFSFLITFSVLARLFCFHQLSIILAGNVIRV